MKYEDVQVRLIEDLAYFTVTLQYRVLSKKVKVTVEKINKIADYSKRSSHGKDRFEVVVSKYIYTENIRNCNFEDIKANLSTVSQEILEGEDISVKEDSYILTTGMTLEELSKKKELKKMLKPDTHLNILDFLKRKTVSAY